MNLLREYYDRVLLMVAATVLFISLIFISRDAVQLHSQIVITPQPPLSKSLPPITKTHELEAVIEKLNAPPKWMYDGPSGLFVPERHFVGADGLPATLQTADVHPPVPNQWLEQFRLPVTDADVLEQDPDHDGFDNVDEWIAQTNPIDPDSHPDYITKLKLKSATEEPFRLVFSSWVGDAYAINTLDLKQPTQFVRVGDSIKGTHFRVAKFVEKYEPNQYGTTVDVSELNLEQEETHQQLTLVKEKVATSPESVATFVYTWGGRQEFQVRNHQEFSLKPHELIKYKLINVGPNKVVIVNSQRSGEAIEIGLFNP
jgi:hypothetical protein